AMDKRASVGVSLGAASCPSDGVGFDELIVEADKIMYTRKSARKIELSTSDDLSSDPEVKIEEVSQFIGPLQIENADETELSSEAYVVELDETHIISSAVN